jgi:hypothetical protein
MRSRLRQQYKCPKYPADRDACESCEVVLPHRQNSRRFVPIRLKTAAEKSWNSLECIQECGIVWKVKVPGTSFSAQFTIIELGGAENDPKYLSLRGGIGRGHRCQQRVRSNSGAV